MPGGSADDASAFSGVLAGTFDSALRGVVGDHLVREVEAARRGLLSAASRAQGKGRGAPMSAVARVPVLLWGWADYLVLANAAGRHVDDVGGHRAPVLLAVGVAAPGQKDMSALAVSYDTIPVRAQAVASAAGGVVVGGVIGGVAGWPGWLDAVAAAGLGVAGAAGLVTWYRSRIGNRRLSYRLPADDPTAPALLAALAVLMKLAAFLARFDADMAKEAKRRGVQPIALDLRTRQVPAAIH